MAIMLHHPGARGGLAAIGVLVLVVARSVPAPAADAPDYRAVLELAKLPSDPVVAEILRVSAEVFRLRPDLLQERAHLIPMLQEGLARDPAFARFAKLDHKLGSHIDESGQYGVLLDLSLRDDPRAKKVDTFWHEAQHVYDARLIDGWSKQAGLLPSLTITVDFEQRGWRAGRPMSDAAHDAFPAMLPAAEQEEFPEGYYCLGKTPQEAVVTQGPDVLLCKVLERFAKGNPLQFSDERFEWDSKQCASRAAEMIHQSDWKPAQEHCQDWLRQHLPR